MSLLLKNISLPLASFTLAVDLEIRGRIAVLFGPSGAGKTSLLDVIAGLRDVKSALIQLDDQILTDTAKRRQVPPRDRRIGYVPQDLALFPHLTVRQNLVFGFKPGKDEVSNNLSRVVETLEIGGLMERSVTQLSGGEKQRVALGRALLSAPQLLLLDEPLANLDQALKSKIIPYLTRIRDEFRIPMLYVTHDMNETLALADEMIVMIEGKLVQQGRVEEVVGKPASVAVAGLLKVETVCPGRVQKIEEELVTVLAGTARLIASGSGTVKEGQEVFVCIHSDDVILTRGEAFVTSARNRLAVTVISVTRIGTLMRVELDGGFTLVAQLTKQACEDLALKPGERLIALIKAPHVHLISR